MNKLMLCGAALLMTSSLSAHAGLFDALSKVNQVMNVTRDVVPQQAPAPAAAPTFDANQLAQGLTAMDCASLNAMSSTLQQQLSALPQESQVSKTAGLLGKAGGLFASVAGATGVNVPAMQQAAQMANSANSIASSTSTTNSQTASALNQQLAAVRIMQQSKACQ